MATYSADYTQSNLLSPADPSGPCIKVQHGINKDQVHVSIWRRYGTTKWLDRDLRVRHVSNNEVRVYVGELGGTFAIDVRVSD